MSLIGRNATQTLYKRSRIEGDADAEWEGGASLYDPPVGEDALAFACVYEPGYRDPGRDAPETRNGRILTETELSLRDLVLVAPDAEVSEGQEVTEVNPQFNFDGSLDFYEAFL